MNFIYETYGPFPIERDGNKFRKAAFAKLWADLAEEHPHLHTAIGIYILAVRSKKGAPLKPWYVGKTDKQSFKKRFDQQLARFSDVLDLARNGTPCALLLARLTPNRRGFMKARSKALASNDDLETMMIASCLRQNENLINASKIKHAKGLVVPGYMNNEPGSMTSAASELNRMVKVKSK